MGTKLSPSGHSPQFSVHVYCGQTAGWIKMPLGTEIGLSPGDIVLNGDPPLPPRKKRNGHSPYPNFRPMSIVAKPLDGSRWHLAWRWAQSRAHYARWGLSPPPQKRGQRPLVFGLSCQTAVYIRVPLSTEVGISLGDIVLDGDPDLPPLKRHSPQFLANVRYG